MGKRGPLPKSKKVLSMRGSPKGKGRKGHAEKPATPTQLPADPPQMPHGFGAEEKAQWDYIIPKLLEMGLLGSCDREALARYCKYAVRYWATERYLDKYGTTYTVEDGQSAGQVKQYPEVNLSLKLADHLLKLERQFGLTPGARVGMSIERTPPKRDDGKDRFFA